MFVLQTRNDVPDSASDLQGSLLASGPAGLPTSVAPVQRVDLGRGAWLDLASGWLPGSDAWFSQMAEELPWSQAARPMYERLVAVPRLLCDFPDSSDPDIPLGLLRLRPLFETYYQRPFPRISANWYRDGRDSVAFHADKVPYPGDAVVAIVAVGERRPFQVRPAIGGRARSFSFGRGDLLIMGGTTQSFFHHGVPKISSDASRISLMFRG